MTGESTPFSSGVIRVSRRVSIDSSNTGSRSFSRSLALQSPLREKPFSVKARSVQYRTKHHPPGVKAYLPCLYNPNPSIGGGSTLTFIRSALPLYQSTFRVTTITAANTANNISDPRISAVSSLISNPYTAA